VRLPGGVRYDSHIRIQLSLGWLFIISLLLMLYTYLQCHGRSSPSSHPTLTTHRGGCEDGPASGENISVYLGHPCSDGGGGW